jgi:Fic family protein
LETIDIAVLQTIAQQRETLRYSVVQFPNRWIGLLRRNTFARAVQGSNTIEGINANLNEIDAIVDDERPETVEEEVRQALLGYRDALTYIIQAHGDPHFSLSAHIIRALHFMMLKYDLTKLPGKYRPGPIRVVRDPDSQTVYEGPDAARVPTLMNELVESLSNRSDQNPIVTGAMAHLNLTMIHPFRDGNGRMARALQTLVLAQSGALSPEFCSIEEWLGRNTDAYYQILGRTGQGKWNPGNDALPWVRFCIKAHYQQAATLIQRGNTMAQVSFAVEIIAAKHKIPDRSVNTLINAAFGMRVRSSQYQADNSVSDVVAGKDLRKLCDIGLLNPIGEKRGRYYLATDSLKEIYRTARAGDVRVNDPYDT